MPPRTVGGLKPLADSFTPEELVPSEIGASDRFWVGDLNTPAMRQIKAHLYVKTAHVEMWVEEGQPIDESALRASALHFEQQIYPTNRRYFGSEWRPGIDGNPRVIVLNAAFQGSSGYFSSMNEYPRQIFPQSNVREMIIINLNALQPGTTSYDLTLAHEFQHMIHWYQDSNEAAWVNEGASELAEDLNGAQVTRATVAQFLSAPDLQLNSWSDDPKVHQAHYGASYLIMRYVLDRFGPDFIRYLVASKKDGIAGFEETLQKMSEPISFRDVFADWLIANLVDDCSTNEGRYCYPSIDLTPLTPQEDIRSFPFFTQEEVHQFGADYYRIHVPAILPTYHYTLTLSFEGNSSVRIVPCDPPSGIFMWWSNRGDAGHSFLERKVDLTHVKEAKLTFDLWYDIEAGWDYAYARASTDNGQTWQPLRGNYMTTYNPIGNGLTMGYTGRSGQAPNTGEDTPSDAQWVRETIDLTPYCGQQVLIRFDYITDDAVTGAGLCLDNIAIDPLFYDDVERQSDDWHANGFVRLDNQTPQTFIVQIVDKLSGLCVQRWILEGDSRGMWNFSLPEGPARSLWVIVAGITPTTEEKAVYRLKVDLDVHK